MPVRNRFAEWHQELTAWRHDFHRHPELMFDTHRTAGIVAERLRAFGCDEVVEGIGRTGVVGVIHGRQTGSGRVIGLRADMDALPIEEATGADHASTIPGKMHACGHDGHTTMLLGAARYLAETRNFSGTAVVIFQPAEEGGGGGLEMVRDGLMERFGIEEVYGMHNAPNMEPGGFAIRPGPILASADQFDLTISGRGGHAAHPHLCTDQVLIAAQIVTALQSLVARNTDPMHSAVVTVANIRTDSTAHNVVASQAVLSGTVRTLDEADRDRIEAGIRRLATSIAEGFGAQAELDYQRGYPSTVNSASETDHAAAAARAVAGSCETVPAQMGAEDFSYMLQARPGAFIFLGNGPGAMWHHPKFDFNDAAIPAGCSYWVELVERRLS